MIAFPNTIGKIYHQILSTRLSDYLTSNNLIDKTIQKGFISRINGTIEHNQVYSEILAHAKHNKHSLHTTFFDLEDAFGSVQHSLIEHSLTRFQVPDEIKFYILNLYSNLHGSVHTKQWNSKVFPFNKGVFQGDPLSPIIFLCCFNPIIEKLQQVRGHGYLLGSTRHITLPFADDFNLLTTDRRTHQ
jgi:hypothetical protein